MLWCAVNGLLGWSSTVLVYPLLFLCFNAELFFS